MSESTVKSYTEQEWRDVQKVLFRRFGKSPDLQSIIFIIGHRELGKNLVKLTKEQKQDIMHIGVCTLLQKAGYYKFLYHDEDGWPHFERVRGMPRLESTEQENLLKTQIIDYIKSL